jgi:hypothetical protein
MTPAPPPRRPTASAFWRGVGITLVTLVLLSGLALLAFYIFIFVAMSNYGSNK